MMLPTAPVVPMDLGDDFKFGPTVLDPIQPEDQENLVPINGFPSVDPAGGDVAMSQLDVLAHFFGTYSGFGFNTIFRPNGTTTPTPLPILPPSNDPRDPNDNILQLNLTSESLAFAKGRLDDVPNRGLNTQADIMLNGVPYTQTIADITEIVKPPKQQPVIHFEPGLWMHVPASKMPNLAASLSRMASIPHGTSINAQSFTATITAKGAPVFSPVDITPTIIANGQKFEFRSQTLTNKNTHRLPQDLTSFDKAGTITQAILTDPNTVLRNANIGKNIIENTTFEVSSEAQNPNLGGGTSNIGFLIGADAGVSSASVAARSGNANAVRVTAQYWLSRVRTQINLPACKSADKRTVSPASHGPRDAVPRFLVDIDVPAAKTVNIEYIQIQYSQNVALDFNGLSWPHVTVGTLAPTIRHKLSQVLVSH